MNEKTAQDRVTERHAEESARGEVSPDRGPNGSYSDGAWNEIMQEIDRDIAETNEKTEK